MISAQQQLLLKQYQERSFVSSILAEEACNYFSFIKNIINIPLIICNSAMVCINSSITDQRIIKDFKYYFKFINRFNIIINI